MWPVSASWFSQLPGGNTHLLLRECMGVTVLNKILRKSGLTRWERHLNLKRIISNHLCPFPVANDDLVIFIRKTGSIWQEHALKHKQTNHSTGRVGLWIWDFSRKDCVSVRGSHTMLTVSPWVRMQHTYTQTFCNWINIQFCLGDHLFCERFMIKSSSNWRLQDFLYQLSWTFISCSDLRPSSPWGENVSPEVPGCDTGDIKFSIFSHPSVVYVFFELD